jgi:hypothetical protein
MIKQQPTLLKDPNKPSRFRIDLTLQEKKTAKFEYNDRFMAREHYEQLRAQGVCGGLAIKSIEFTEVIGK